MERTTWASLPSLRSQAQAELLQREKEAAEKKAEKERKACGVDANVEMLGAVLVFSGAAGGSVVAGSVSVAGFGGHPPHALAYPVRMRRGERMKEGTNVNFGRGDMRDTLRDTSVCEEGHILSIHIHTYPIPCAPARSPWHTKSLFRLSSSKRSSRRSCRSCSDRLTAAWTRGQT